MASNKELGEKYGIHPRDVEKIKFAFEVYDFTGDGKVDAFFIGDLIRACNLNPTMHTIEEIGGQKEKGKKSITMLDLYPIFKAAKDSKDTGGIHDFVEILRLYDKNEDKTMLSKDLYKLLSTLGEKLTKDEAKSLMKELCDPEDDEGFTPFMPFLERMCKNDVA
jgi:myosin light chain 6